jgi:hypothetical protein
MSLRWLTVALFSLCAAPALAVDQGDWQLGVGPTFALLVENENPTSGLGGRVEGRYGLTDGASVYAALASSWHPRGAEQVRASSGSAGFTLAFDVFRVIPFAEVGATFSDLRGGITRGRYLGIEGAGGAEYLLDRRWSVAAVARYQYLPLRLAGTAERGPGVLTAGLRISHNF